MNSHGCSFRAMLLEDLKKHAVVPTVALETSSKEILKQFAASRLGVAFMPEMAARAELKARKLVQLAWKGADFPIYSQLLVYKGKSLSKAIDALVKMLAGGKD